MVLLNEQLEALQGDSSTERSVRWLIRAGQSCNKFRAYFWVGASKTKHNKSKKKKQKKNTALPVVKGGATGDGRSCVGCRSGSRVMSLSNALCCSFSSTRFTGSLLLPRLSISFLLFISLSGSPPTPGCCQF